MKRFNMRPCIGGVELIDDPDGYYVTYAASRAALDDHNRQLESVKAKLCKSKEESRELRKRLTNAPTQATIEVYEHDLSEAKDDIAKYREIIAKRNEAIADLQKKLATICGVERGDLDRFTVEFKTPTPQVMSLNTDHYTIDRLLGIIERLAGK